MEFKFEKLIICQKGMDYGFAIRSLAEVVTCLQKSEVKSFGFSNFQIFKFFLRTSN